MSENFEFSQESKEIRTGNFAKVQMLDTEVIVQPRSPLPASITDVNEKMNNQEIFNQMFSNFDGIKICPIKEKDSTQGRYVVQRAEGINLTNIQNEQEGDIKSFLTLSTDIKTNGILIYLRMLKELNSKGYSFQDHKGDSIFIQKVPENKSSSTLSIIDAGSLTKNNNSEDSWSAELKGGLKETLESFFTRGNNIKEIESLIPTGIRTILNRIDSYPNADSLLSDVRAYVRGGKNINTFDHNERKNSILIRLRYLKDSTSLNNAIVGRDFSQLSQYEIDRWEIFINSNLTLENIPLMNVLEGKYHKK
ncbi:MAG: hypothetical protein RBT33_01410 [Candidatus Dojkabacteria bacterium]|nr:hypothetical protein [Candidatus Dojkabacteria bacterium]